MIGERTKISEPKIDRHFSFSERSQQRHERWMAKEAARNARRAARAQHPCRDWTFEIRAGDQVYSFNWRWHGGSEFTMQGQGSNSPASASAEVSNEPQISDEDQ